ncbi:MAG: hypothetical protein HOH77_22075 [Candidatus Latescibacteria bacterium]|nr:hypothetical protein [Candidatus Latescibacterota bacterium]
MNNKFPNIATILLSLTTIALLAIPVIFDQQANDIKRHTNTLQQKIHHLQNGIYKTEILQTRAQAQNHQTQLLTTLGASLETLKTQTQASQDLTYQAARSSIQIAETDRQKDLSTALQNLDTYEKLNETTNRYLSEAQDQVLHLQNQITEYAKTQIKLNTRRTHWLIGCVAFLTIGLALALLSAYWT